SASKPRAASRPTGPCGTETSVCSAGATMAMCAWATSVSESAAPATRPRSRCDATDPLPRRPGARRAWRRGPASEKIAVVVDRHLVQLRNAGRRIGRKSEARIPGARRGQTGPGSGRRERVRGGTHGGIDVDVVVVEDRAVRAEADGAESQVRSGRPDAL